MTVRIAPRRSVLLSTTSVMPGSFAIENSRPSPGRLRSRSTATTFFPALARATARFAAVVVLPSPSVPLATMIVVASRSRLISSRFVRKIRKASASTLRGCSRDTMPVMPLGGAGIRASNGNWSASAISTGDRSLVSVASRMSAKAMPPRMPSMSPITAARTGRGCTWSAVSAGRTSCALVVCSAPSVRNCLSCSDRLA